MPLRICIVTWAHVSNNPRVVKEADALSEAGHEVRVVAHDADAEYAKHDRLVLESRRWGLELLSLRGEPRSAWARRRVAQRAARLAFDAGVRATAVRDYALAPYTAPLASLVANRPADLVIGHNLRALPGAARGARLLGARLAFDFEDLHFAEAPDSPSFMAERELVRAVERAYVPRCDRLTASAPGIAEEVGRAYGVPRPEVIYNVFGGGASGRPATAAAAASSRVLSLYWYSQIIGPERGLEDVVRALGRLPAGVELHLRGRVSPEYRSALLSLAAEAGVAGALRFHDAAPSDTLVGLAAEHDVGLALEQPLSLNRDLCVTNKMFTYFAAGIAVAATRTRGQREVLARVPGCGFHYQPGDVESLAGGLRRFIDSPDVLAGAKAASRAAAQDTFNLRSEQSRLVAYLTGKEGRAASTPVRAGAAAERADERR